MADIIKLPGVERHDLEEKPVCPILQTAMNAGITESIVIGTAPNGALYFHCPPGDGDRVAGMLMRVVVHLCMSSVGEPDGEEDGDED